MEKPHTTARTKGIVATGLRRGGIVLRWSVLAVLTGTFCGCVHQENRPATVVSPKVLKETAPAHTDTGIPGLNFGEIKEGPSNSTPIFHEPGQRPLYTLVKVLVAAAAEPHSHSLMTHITVKGLSRSCSGKVITLDYSGDWRAVTSKNGNPPVLIEQRLLCLPVSSKSPPWSLIGVRLHGRTLTQDLSVGSQYLSPNPNDFQGQGASLYVPAIQGGYLVSAFAVGGALETNEGLGPSFPTVAIALSAEWLSGPVLRSHYFLSTETPGSTPLADALSVRVGAPRPGEPPVRLYQDDVWGFSDGDSGSATP